MNLQIRFLILYASSIRWGVRLINAGLAFLSGAAKSGTVSLLSGGAGILATFVLVEGAVSFELVARWTVEPWYEAAAYFIGTSAAIYSASSLIANTEGYEQLGAVLAAGSLAGLAIHYATAGKAAAIFNRHKAKSS